MSKYRKERSALKKQHLPSKVCAVCEKPFNWRKKWESVWHEVRYCSERCRRNKNKDTSPHEHK
ncbi:DUF2256 domain-containing protein [Aliidiomarina sp.]|uniref:DUF2256 domain-containing protein n=1 Tax=Aliidiomarina sp. TaxID=1872439 RepID=UPI003A4D9546